MSIDELIDAVEKDKNNHQTKALAELFIAAMNDWPTVDQFQINDFVKELKDYFGIPLTIDRISFKPINLLHAWKHESGVSISEMIALSEKFNNESNFDKIITDILSYYNLPK